MFSLMLAAASAFANGEAAQTFTLDGRLYADAASTTALTDPDVTITLQVLNPTQNCILYEETQSHFNAAIGNGYFTLQVGSAIGAGKRSSLDSAHAMSLVYSNTAASISGRTLGGGACTYSPAAGDVRTVRMLVTPSKRWSHSDSFSEYGHGLCSDGNRCGASGECSGFRCREYSSSEHFWV